MAVDLAALFSQGNPFLAQQGQQQWEQEQTKSKADLQSVLGQEQRAKEMQPFDIAHKQALTRTGNANAATIEDTLAGQIPASERLKLAMAEKNAKLTGLQREQADQEMYQMGQWAAMVKQNNGKLPLSFLGIPQDKQQYFTDPKNVDNVIGMVKAFHDTHPKTIEARAKQQAELEKARIMAQSRVEAAGASAAGRGAGKNIIKTIDAKLIALQDELANASTDEEKQYIKDQINYFQAYASKKAQDAAIVKQAGNPDLSSRIPVQSGQPSAPLAPPERKGASAPAAPQPLSQDEKVNKWIKSQPIWNYLDEQYRTGKMTEQQVKAKLKELRSQYKE